MGLVKTGGSLEHRRRHSASHPVLHSKIVVAFAAESFVLLRTGSPRCPAQIIRYFGVELDMDRCNSPGVPAVHPGVQEAVRGVHVRVSRPSRARVRREGNRDCPARRLPGSGKGTCGSAAKSAFALTSRVLPAVASSHAWSRPSYIHSSMYFLRLAVVFLPFYLMYTVHLLARG